jgi:hypothetical protein
MFSALPVHCVAFRCIFKIAEYRFRPLNNKDLYTSIDRVCRFQDRSGGGGGG